MCVSAFTDTISIELICNKLLKEPVILLAVPPLSIAPHPWRVFIYKRKGLCGSFYAPYSFIDSFIYSPLQYPTTPTLTLCGVKGISPSV